MPYSNRTYDNSALPPQIVVWTTSSPDITGAAYPGPGVFGVDTTGYYVDVVPDVAGGGSNVFVYDSGSPPEDNRYDDWAELYAATQNLHGQIVIELVTNLTIPPGAYVIPHVKFTGGTSIGGTTPTVQFAAGVTLSTMRFDAELIAFIVQDPTTPPVSMVTGNWTLMQLGFTMSPLLNLTGTVAIESRDLVCPSGTQLANLTNANVSILCEGLTSYDDGALIGDGTSAWTTLLTSAASTFFGDLPTTMPGLAGSYTVFRLSRATEVYYTAGFVSPSIPVNTVQEALDFLKTNTNDYFVWSPLGVAAIGVYTDWATLYAAVQAAPIAKRTVLLDGSATIDAGPHDCRGWTIIGVSQNKPVLTISDSSLISGGSGNGTLRLENLEIVQTSSGVTVTATDADQLYVSAKNVTFTAQAGCTNFRASGAGAGIFNVTLEDCDFVTDIGETAFVYENTTATCTLKLIGSTDVSASNTLSVDVGCTLGVVVRSAEAVYDIAGQAGVNGTVNVTVQPVAANVTYDDAVTPTLGQTRVQEALDVLKSRTIPFVFRPGGVEAGSVYTSWASLYAAVTLAHAQDKRVWVDNSISNPEIPAGAWNLDSWEFIGHPHVAYASNLDILEGATLSGLAGSGEYTLVFRNIVANYLGTSGPFGLQTAGSKILKVILHASGLYNTTIATFQNDGTSGFTSIMLLYNGSESGGDGGGTFGMWDLNTGGYLSCYVYSQSQIEANLVEGDATANATFHVVDPSAVVTSPSGPLFVGNFAKINTSTADNIDYTDNTTAPNLLSPSSVGSVQEIVDAIKPVLLRYALPACTNETVVADIGTPEITVGGFAYNPGSTAAADRNIYFEAMAAPPTVTATIRLYDMGTPGSWGAGTLRSTITVSSANGRSRVQLTPVASPGTNTDEIHNVEHLYEVRVLSDAAEDIYVYWAGLKLN